MLPFDLPFLDLGTSPKEAFAEMRKAGRSAIVTGSADEFRLIRAEDVVRAIQGERHVIAELPYQPAGGLRALFTGQLDFTIQHTSSGVARGISASERKGGPLLAGPVDCYCLLCGTPTHGAADGDSCIVCGGSIHCVRY